jgi:copper(I)-binding protein
MKRIITLAANLGLMMFASTVLAQPKVSEAWIRLMPPNVTMTAAYATISSDSADMLVSVSSDIAGKAEIHETSMENGMMNMRPIEAVDIEVGSVVELKPQGKHIMLIDLTRSLEEGEQVDLELEFTESGKQSVSFTVRKP